MGSVVYSSFLEGIPDLNMTGRLLDALPFLRSHPYRDKYERWFWASNPDFTQLVRSTE